MEKVEPAFRAAKDEFDIRPRYVRKETRIRGHVTISYFTLLIETLTKKKPKELFSEAYDREEKWIRKIRRSGEEPLTMISLFEGFDSMQLIPESPSITAESISGFS